MAIFPDICVMLKPGTRPEGGESKRSTDKPGTRPKGGESKPTGEDKF